MQSGVIWQHTFIIDEDEKNLGAGNLVIPLLNLGKSPMVLPTLYWFWTISLYCFEVNWICKFSLQLFSVLLPGLSKVTDPWPQKHKVRNYNFRRNEFQYLFITLILEYAFETDICMSCMLRWTIGTIVSSDCKGHILKLSLF